MVRMGKQWSTHVHCVLIRLDNNRIGHHVEYLQSQFALVGDKADKTVLVKDGPSDYLLYVSGRRNVQYGHWWIKVIDAYTIG